jgi:hypothetical protein
VWDRTAALVPHADHDTLVVYCCAVADYNRAQGILDRVGPLVPGQKGAAVRNPAHSIKASNAGIIRTLARDLGLHDDGTTAPGRYRNQAATEKTIASLRQLGHIEPVDEATLALVRTVALALDRLDPEVSPAPMASLARVQLSALKMLRGQDSDSDTLAAVLAGLSAEVGDAPES